MLDMDKGSWRIGEFAFGTNYGIKKYTKNTLFDEKNWRYYSPSSWQQLSRDWKQKQIKSPLRYDV